MELWTQFAIIGIAAFIHASFQLSISVLTLLSGHAIGAKRSHLRVMNLVSSYLLGILLSTTLLISTAAMLFTGFIHEVISPIIWVTLSGLALGLGVAVWVFYYKRQKGTALWLPRNLALFLAKRAKSTRSASESLSLGVMSVFCEIVFIAVPVAIAALAVCTLPQEFQLVAIFAYVIIASTPLLSVAVLLGGGHRISIIQKWRETHKYFLQFIGGSALIILAAFIYVNEVLAVSVAAGGM